VNQQHRTAIAGSATESGTARYRDRFSDIDPAHFRSRLGRWLSTIGVGTYLGGHDRDTDTLYRAAIVAAVRQGCNLIDTAINYRFQRSERTLAEALTDLTRHGIGRDELIVCTKGGYLAFEGGPADDARGWIERTYIQPGIMSWSDIISFNVMHPGFIRHELQRSLENLGLSTIDVYYLHNPEAQLDAVDRSEFAARMRSCFEELEHAAAAGTIGVYGTATWSGYRVAPGAQGYLSLEELVAIARSVAGADHRFRVIQVPFNLAMPEALTVRNQRVDGELLTILEAAERFGMTAVASASLDQARLTHLSPEVARLIPGLETDAQRALQFARSAPGVTTALVGMKDPEHVEENMRVPRVPPLDDEVYRVLFG
jgi:aryl-alcohol dehydrogenase-like predicted oxidoreductase